MARFVRSLGFVLVGALVLYALATLVWFDTGQHTQTATGSCNGSGSDEWVPGGRACLHVRVYRSATRAAHPNLIVVLHGDLQFPSYQYATARKLSEAMDSVVAVGLLRPGYTDDRGNRSSGVSGRAVGDNYTPEDVDAIAAAIDTLKRTYQAESVMLVGHSGGAAITADIIGRHPGLVQAAVLVSCPCNLGVWRRHMFAMQHQLIWWLPVHSLSPIDLVSGVDPRTTVKVIVGSDDVVAPPPLSQAYAERLRERHVPVTLVEIPGAPHNILLDPRVLREIIDAGRAPRAATPRSARAAPA